MNINQKAYFLKPFFNLPPLFFHFWEKLLPYFPGFEKRKTIQDD
jgi:hypothetical protein